MSDDAETVRILNFLAAARLKAGADLVAGHTCSIDRDSDGALCVVTRTRINLTIEFDEKIMSQCIDPNAVFVPPGATLEVREASPGNLRVETIKHADGRQDVKIGGTSIG